MSSPLQKCVESVEIEDIFTKYARHVEFMGNDLDDVEQIGAFGSQVIHLASFANQCKDITALVQAGANANAFGDLGFRPLHSAVLGGAVDAVRVLLQSGADAYTENEFGETPAQMAHILHEVALEEVPLCIAGQMVAACDDGLTAR